MTAGMGRVWRGPCLDWLQHTWLDSQVSPPWGGTLQTFRGVVISTISGYPAASVPWDIVQGLAEGAARVTRLDICVDCEGWELDRNITEEELVARGAHDRRSLDGYTRYKGAKDSELQWRAYHYFKPEEKRPWLWLQEAHDAKADLRRYWRIEAQARGRVARQLAAMPSIAHAWAALQHRWPERWPRVECPDLPSRVLSHKTAEISSARDLAERCRKYIRSQTRRCARKVGLTPDETRHLLMRVAIETLAEMTGHSGDGVDLADLGFDDDASGSEPDTLVGEPDDQGDTDHEPTEQA